MSRVIHLRTSERNIAACFLILESNGLNTNIPISTAVHSVLEAVITGLISKKVIPLDMDDVHSVIAHYTKEPELTLSELPLDFDSETDSGAGVNGVPSEIERSDIVAALEHVKSGGIRAEAPDELPAVPIDAPPWEDFDRLSYDALKVAYPKDAMVERAVDVPMLQRAIEVVYKAIPNTRWHEPKTMDMVNRLSISFDVWRAENKA